MRSCAAPCISVIDLYISRSTIAQVGGDRHLGHLDPELARIRSLTQPLGVEDAELDPRAEPVVQDVESYKVLRPIRHASVRSDPIEAVRRTNLQVELLLMHTKVFG